MFAFSVPPEGRPRAPTPLISPTALATGALGVTVALAWNDAVLSAVDALFPRAVDGRRAAAATAAYAIVVTVFVAAAAATFNAVAARGAARAARPPPSASLPPAASPPGPWLRPGAAGSAPRPGRRYAL